MNNAEKMRCGRLRRLEGDFSETKGRCQIALIVKVMLVHAKHKRIKMIVLTSSTVQNEVILHEIRMLLHLKGAKMSRLHVKVRRCLFNK